MTTTTWLSYRCWATARAINGSTAPGHRPVRSVMGSGINTGQAMSPWFGSWTFNNKPTILPSAHRSRPIEILTLSTWAYSWKSWSPQKYAHLVLTDSNNRRQQLKLPLAKGEQKDIVQVALVDHQNSTRFTIKLKQPAAMHTDGSLRIKLAAKRLANKQAVANQLQLSFAQPAKFFRRYKPTSRRY